jgi:DNA-directed RNA polymerase subunit RPC12/RpoP
MFNVWSIGVGIGVRRKRMKAYKCDRCGALFEPNLDADKYRVEKYEGDWEYEEVDLCPSCLIELDRFMKEKRQ